MSEDLFIPWVLQRATIGTAVLAGLIPALIANLKQRPMLRWYCYGRRLYTGGLAPDRPADGPRANFTAANRVAGGPAKATSSRCARSARGKQRSIVSNLDSGPQTQIARGGRSSPLYLQGDQAWRVDRAHSRTCQSKQRGGISTPRRSPRLRAEATPLGRASLRRRPSSCRYRRQDQSWWSLSPTRKVRARSNCRP